MQVVQPSKEQVFARKNIHLKHFEHVVNTMAQVSPLQIPSKIFKTMRHVKQEIRKQGVLITESRKTYAKTMKSIQEYLDSIEDTPTYACAICEHMQFAKDMYGTNSRILSDFEILTTGNGTKDIGINEKLCKQCKNAIWNE